jgi:glycyl-tRNA synthetase beta chain
MNTSADPEGLVRQGNERVLRARFNDARFFWQNDLKRKLEDRLEDLKHVTFQAKLGSYWDKTHQNEIAVQALGGDEHALRAAKLCKCDLTTDMVKEFTDLQGIMGGLYAKAQGEPDDVSLAIYDHYKPLSMEDPIPRTLPGRIVALADKLATLEQCFAVRLIPSGSKDPFALRRAAQGVVRIIVEGKLNVPLTTGDPDLLEFFRDRIEYYFRDTRNHKYDEVRACMAAGWKDLLDLEARLQRVQAIRPTPDFEPLAASFKRIKNILKQADLVPGRNINPALLEAGPEQDLYTEYQLTAGQPLETRIAAMRPKIDLFFDKVLVNTPDMDIRINRLTLLHNLLTEFSTIADFSEIVTEKQS